MKNNEYIIKRFKFDLEIGRFILLNNNYHPLYSFRILDFNQLKLIDIILKKCGYICQNIIDYEKYNIYIGVTIDTVDKTYHFYISPKSNRKINAFPCYLKDYILEDT